MIDDLERDIRLTRSVHFHRDFFRSRTIMGAHEAAYTALTGLLKTSFFGAASTGGNLTARGLEGRKAVADRIRAYWEKNRGVPLVERWYRTLADDVAAPGRMAPGRREHRPARERLGRPRQHGVHRRRSRPSSPRAPGRSSAARRSATRRTRASPS